MECHPCASLRRHCSPPAINPCLAILVRLNDPPVNDYTRLFSYSLKFQQFREACAKNSSTASERTGPSDSTRVVAISTSPFKFSPLSLSLSVHGRSTVWTAISKVERRFTHPSIKGTSLSILRAAASRSPAWAASKILVSS